MESIPSDRCLVALPKKGRLAMRLMPLLEKIGVVFTRKHRLDIAHVTDPSNSFSNLTLIFLPAHDIATFVSLGRVDMGITGRDITTEAGEHSKVEVVSGLGFGICRLSLCVPKGTDFKTPEALIGKRIATSFPHITTHFFDGLDASRAGTTQVVQLSGSVEVACSLGLADAIVDLVETGNTLNAAGLVELHTILETEAIMIVNPKSEHKTVANKIVKRLNGVMIAEKYVMLEYDIPKAQLENAKLITPGKVSPSISGLLDPDWVAVRVLQPKQALNDVLDSLEAIGALYIVVTNVENTRCS